MALLSLSLIWTNQNAILIVSCKTGCIRNHTVERQFRFAPELHVWKDFLGKKLGRARCRNDCRTTCSNNPFRRKCKGLPCLQLATWAFEGMALELSIKYVSLSVDARSWFRTLSDAVSPLEESTRISRNNSKKISYDSLKWYSTEIHVLGFSFYLNWAFLSIWRSRIRVITILSAQISDQRDLSTITVAFLELGMFKKGSIERRKRDDSDPNWILFLRRHCCQMWKGDCPNDTWKNQNYNKIARIQERKCREPNVRAKRIKTTVATK